MMKILQLNGNVARYVTEIFLIKAKYNFKKQILTLISALKSSNKKFVSVIIARES